MFKTIMAVFCLFILSLPTAAATYNMPKPGNDIVGHVYTVKAESGDTLAKIGLRYGMSLHEMLEANPDINMGTTLRAGRKVIIPGQFILPPYRDGIVVNMAELRLYYFTADGKYVMTFPVAMGRDQWRTPTVTTKVIQKVADPVWHVPESVRAYTLEHSGELLPEKVLPGPDNPLGPYALYLGKSGYLIHGNNSPTSIGKFVSSGCIRMNNQDISTLYQLVNVGTPVRIIHTPYKLGWYNGKLYLESQLPVVLPDELPSDLNQASVAQAIDTLLNKEAAHVDWDAVNQTVKDHLGIPELVGTAVEANLATEG